jgi:hypothetical protein
MSRRLGIQSYGRAALVSLAAALTACAGGGGGSGSGSGTPPPPPVANQPQITSFTATPGTINSGEPVVLAWTSTNTTDCSVVAEGGSATAGSLTVASVTQNTSFELKCDGAPGTTEATAMASVVVIPPPPASSYAITTTGPSTPGVYNDVLWDATHQVLYVALDGVSTINPNTVTAIDPTTGALGVSVFAGSDPRALAESDDGQYLYVGLGGADVIRRFLLPGLTADIAFSSDPDFPGGDPLFARYITVAPGAPGTIAVGRIDPQDSLTLEVLSSFSPFVVFDNATARASASPPPSGYPDYALAWGANASTLYGASASSDLATSVLDTYSTSSTVTLIGTQSSAAVGVFPGGMTASDGLTYDNLGNVINLVTGQIVGNFGNAHGVALPDAANNRIFYADVDLNGQFTLQSYDLTTHLPLGAIARAFAGYQIPVRHIVRWGVDGLALTFFGGEMMLVSGPFVAPGGTSPPANALPTQSNAGLQPAQATLTSVSTPGNDIAFDPTRDVIYASVPSTATSNANSIAVLNASTGAVSSTFATVTNPGPLAVSDDGQYLYVAGATTIQRYLLSNLSLDISIDLSTSGLGACLSGSPTEIKVAPASPNTIGIVINNCAVFFSDTTQQGVFVGTNWIQWGADAATAYAIASYATPIYLSTLNLAGGTVTLGTKVSGKFSTVYLMPFNMQFTYNDGLLYSGTGVVYNPTAQELAGTLALTGGTNINSANGGYYAQDLGISAVNSTSGRVFVAVSTISSPLGVFGSPGITLMSYNSSTYTPVTGASLGLVGPAVELLQLSATSFAVLSPNGQITLVSSPQFAL